MKQPVPIVCKCVTQIVSNILYPLSLILLFAPVASGEDKLAVSIGVLVPLTGVASNLGADITRTLEAAQGQFNSTSTHYQYRFVFEDGKCGIGDAAATAASKFINLQGIKFLITGCSGETFAAAPLAERKHVLLVAVATSHPDAKKLGDYIFRTYLDMEDGVARIAQKIKNDGKKRVAILSEENSFTVGIRDLLRKDLGENMALSLDYPAQEQDFRALLTKIRGEKIDAVYLNCAGPGTCAPLYNQYRAIGLQPQPYSYFYPEHPDVLKICGKNADGIPFFTAPDVENSEPTYQAVMKKYAATYPEGPGTKFISQAAYDAARVIVEGVETNGPNAEAVKDFLYHYDAPGALGRVQFDENGDIKNLHYVLKVVEQGKPRAIE